MLELDECNQLLVTNPFSDDSVTVSSSNINHDTLVTPTLDSLSDHHPLRTRSASPAHRCDIPSITVLDSEGETRPRLTPLLSLDGLPAEEAAEEAPCEAPQGSSDIIIHPIGPNDSFARVALRYGVSIGALRRANQLWPSDPIHLRTELVIQRGDTLPHRHKSTRNASTDTTLGSTVEPTPGSSPDVVASSFVAARNMILSVLPARISLDSLSSKASVSEDHELDNLQLARPPSTSDPPFAEEGHELSILTTPHTHYKRPAVPLSSQVPCSPTNNQHLDLNHIPPVSDLRSRSLSSSRTISLERLPRIQPFAVLPVRTSQLEPEPAMELPVRLPAFNDQNPWTDGAKTSKSNTSLVDH